MLQEFIGEFRDPFPVMAWGAALARLLVAATLGGIIGWEREAHEKPAGLRTHMIVSLASCLFTLLAMEMVELDALEQDHVRADPIRLIEAVTAGVAFLAAGTIINRRGGVRGLTTGAGLWMAGAIGVASGLGEFLLAAFAAGVALIVLWALRLLSD